MKVIAVKMGTDVNKWAVVQSFFSVKKHHAFKNVILPLKYISNKR